MKYDSINGNTYGDEENVKFFTIGDLIDICNQHPTKIVRFFETQYSVGDLGSWRGSYDIPAITPEYEDRCGEQIAKSLQDALKEKHYGYKGGEYTYYATEEFYVAPYGSAAEYKVVKAEVETVDGEEMLVLYTKLDPY